MRTAEEWIGRLPQQFDRHTTMVLTTVDLWSIRAIQLDAYRQGVTDAAETIHRQPERGNNAGHINAILAACDKKTTT